MEYIKDAMEKYPEEYSYVRRLLLESQFDAKTGTSGTEYPFRSRIRHVLRVCMWVRRLLPDFKDIDLEAVEIAAIFHDVGYYCGLNHGHENVSRDIFLEYMKDRDMAPERVRFIADLIANHENKSLMQNEDTSKELVLLMEADIMDEEGAMRVCWDAMAAGQSGARSFEDALNRTVKYFHPESSPMITPLAKAYWDEKQRFVEKYIEELSFDLGLENPLD